MSLTDYLDTAFHHTINNLKTNAHWVRGKTWRHGCSKGLTSRGSLPTESVRSDSSKALAQSIWGSKAGGCAGRKGCSGSIVKDLLLAG